jgi:hypothetical protein
MGPHHDVRYRVGTDLRSCHSNSNERQDPGEPEVDRSWVDVHAMTVSNLGSKPALLWAGAKSGVAIGPG